MNKKKTTKALLVALPFICGYLLWANTFIAAIYVWKINLLSVIVICICLAGSIWAALAYDTNDFQNVGSIFVGMLITVSLLAQLGIVTEGNVFVNLNSGALLQTIYLVFSTIWFGCELFSKQ